MRILDGKLLIKCHESSILFVGHSCEVVTGINLSCPAKEEVLERLESAWPKRISDPRQADLQRKALRSRDRDQLKMIRECSHPVGDQVVLGKSNVRVTAREGFGDIAVGYSKAPRKLFDLVRKDGIARGFSDQGFDRGDIASARCRLNHISLGQACAGSCHIGETVDAERIALADNQRATAVL